MKPVRLRRTAVRPRQPWRQRPHSSTPKIDQAMIDSTVLWARC